MCLHVAWTGHRPDLFANPAAAQAAVDATAAHLARTHAELVFIVGGQRGVDTWAAMAGHRLAIPIRLVLPLPPAQFADSTWTSDDRDTLEYLQAISSQLTIVGADVADPYSARNRLVAELADTVYAIWTGTAEGGTAQTIAFARGRGIPVSEITFDPSERAQHAGGRGI